MLNLCISGRIPAFRAIIFVLVILVIGFLVHQGSDLYAAVAAVVIAAVAATEITRLSPAPAAS